MMDKSEFFNMIKLMTSEFNKNNPCRYCVGNGCDDCRDCSDAKNRYTMETNIYNLKKQYKELYGSDYDADYINSLKDNVQTPSIKKIQVSRFILEEWCERNMNVHSDWTGARVETKETCSTIEEFIDKLWNYLKDASDRMD